MLKDKISNTRTRAARKEAQKQYNEANQEVQRAIKHDKSLLTTWQRKQNQQQINTE